MFLCPAPKMPFNLSTYPQEVSMKNTNLFDLMNQVTPDEEGFLSAEQEPDCELRVYSATGEVTDDGASQ